MSDILDAVPIDKHFELFKPGAGGDGGYIRLSLDFGAEPPQFGGYATDGGRGSGKGGRLRAAAGLLAKAALAGAVAAGAVYGKRWYDRRRGEQGGGGKKAAAGKPAAAKRK